MRKCAQKEVQAVFTDKWADEFVPFDMLADEGLLDLLCEDGLISPQEARKEHSPAQLFALLRRIFAPSHSTAAYRADAVLTAASRSDAPPSLRAPPAAA